MFLPAMLPNKMMPAGARATAIRAALDRWLDAAAAFKRHSEDWPDDAAPAAVHRAYEAEGDRLRDEHSAALDQLIKMVCDLHPISDDTAMGVDLGDTIVIFGPHHDAAASNVPAEGWVLIPIAKSNIIRA
jgi:hypothetical protein